MPSSPTASQDHPTSPLSPSQTHSAHSTRHHRSEQPPAWLSKLSDQPDFQQLIFNLTQQQFDAAVSLTNELQRRVYLYVSSPDLFPPDYVHSTDKFVYYLHNEFALVVLPLFDLLPSGTDVASLYPIDTHANIHADDLGLYVLFPQ
jgi:hypothetical protein